MKQSNLDFTQSSHGTTKEKEKENKDEKPQQVINLVTPDKSQGTHERAMTEAEKYSKIVNWKQVQNYDWTFYDDDDKIELEGIEAVYINPRWKQSKVGDCLTYKVKKGVKNEE